MEKNSLFNKRNFVWVALLAFFWPMITSFLRLLGGNSALFIIILLFVYFIIRKVNNEKNMATIIDVDAENFWKKTKRGLGAAIFLAAALIIFLLSIVVVGAGETGVYSLFGKVSENELSSGFHLVNPLGKVTKMSVRTEEYTMSKVASEGRKMGDDSIAALTKEGLSVDLDVTVLYRLDEKKASDVYRELGVGYSEKFIRPAIRTAIRDSVAQYEAKDIYSDKRAEFSGRVISILKKDLEPRGIILENALIRNVNLPAGLTDSIQQKLQAEQEAQKYDFVLAKEKKEKERKIIEAEGQRDAQKIINESLSPNYLYYQYISTLKDRQGTIYVPTSPQTGMPVFKELGK